MKLEDKQLLFIDLCARLPYGVIVTGKFHYDICIADYICEPLNAKMLDINEWDKPRSSYDHYWYSDIKPYLRPLSSMTEEEKKEFDEILKSCNRKVFACPNEERRYKFFDAEQEDFMNKHHFDYRGLIEMDLAINVNNLNLYN